MERELKKNIYRGLNILMDSVNLIKPELKQEWIDFVSNNIQEKSLRDAINLIITVMKKLTSNFSLDDVIDELCSESPELDNQKIDFIKEKVLHFYICSNIIGPQKEEKVTDVSKSAFSELWESSKIFCVDENGMIIQKKKTKQQQTRLNN